MAELELTGVSMSYGDTRVLHDVSLAVPDGGFAALVGPSGSGKTTMLKVLAGFLTPEAGRVRIGGSDATAMSPEARDLGIVFQNYALFPHMTVKENVAFGLRMRGVARRAARSRVTDMLGLVGLPDLGGRYPDELSGGQQQRVALARALVIEPKALLLDEPLSALDRKIREEMQVELRRIQRETGVTAVIVTHDQEEALALGDRLTVLDHGVVQQEGAPFDVYQHPASPFVATFLGKANLFDAEVVAVAPSHVRLGATEVDGLVLPSEATPGDAVTLCVRPEGWMIADTADADAGVLVVDGVVRLSRQTGQTAEALVTTEHGEVAVTVLSTQVARVREGARVRLAAPAQNVHVLATPSSVTTAAA